jgi:hypothetical protein
MIFHSWRTVIALVRYCIRRSPTQKGETKGHPLASRDIIATETRQEVIGVADVAHIPAEEKHWHGAMRDSEFSHVEE